MWASPHQRILWARILVPLMAILGLLSAISGAWFTVAVMVCLIGAQILVYRRARRDIAEGGR